jgi:hypothetical protein
MVQDTLPQTKKPQDQCHDESRNWHQNGRSMPQPSPKNDTQVQDSRSTCQKTETVAKGRRRGRSPSSSQSYNRSELKSGEQCLKRAEVNADVYHNI